MSAPWLHIVGIGEDGLDGLTPATRTVVETAEIIVGGDRHHTLADGLTAQRVAWPSPFDAMIDTITDSLQKSEPVVLVGFGTFGTKDRAARTGRNPQTGATIEIKAAKVPNFKPGKALKDAVNS